ncbi:hypothetical protein [Pseudomonas sp.]|uniref:hypothetical protein n=1 Tax=Pseudomonas sp. TaxID=306 RepID=UPI003CC6AA96
MKNFIEKEAVILSLIPVVSFICALAFEFGYAEAFGYSSDFIEIDLKSTVLAMFGLVLVLFPFYIYMETVFRLGSSEKRTHKALAMFMIGPLLLMFIALLSGFRRDIVNVALLCTAVAVVFCLVAYLLNVPKYGWNGAWEEMAKLDEVPDRESSKPERSQPGPADKVIAKFFLILSLIAIVFFVRGAGVAAAKWKQSFYVFKLGEKDVAILAGYGDNLVLGGYANGQFDGTTYLLPKSSGEIVGVSRVRFNEFLDADTPIRKPGGDSM